MVTMPTITQQLGAALAVITALAPAADLVAQDRVPVRGLAVVAGPANYDLAGTGWSWSAAARLNLPLTSALLLEPSLGFFTYSSQFLDRISFLLPEVSLQLQYPGQLLQPYLGAGAGLALTIEGYDQPPRFPGDESVVPTDPRVEPSVHAAVGLRAGVMQSLRVQGEARVRNISAFEANKSILEFMLGFTQPF